MFPNKKPKKKKKIIQTNTDVSNKWKSNRLK